MKKFLIITALVVSMLIFAAGYRYFPANPPADDRPYFMRNIANEESIALKVKVDKIDYYYRREVAIVETDEGTAMVVIPYMLSRYYGINVESGVEMEIEGKKLTFNGKAIIIPDKVTINEKTYDMTPAVRKKYTKRNMSRHNRNLQSKRMYKMNTIANSSKRKIKEGAKPSIRRNMNNNVKPYNQRHLGPKR